MEKEITFSDGTGLIIETVDLDFKTGFKKEIGLQNSGELRIFIPDWGKLLSSESFLHPFFKRYGSEQFSEFNIAFYLEYYRATHFDLKGQYLRSTLKNTRTFKINSMDYNNRIRELLTKQEKTWPTKKEADNAKLKIEYSILDVTGHSVQKLFFKAAYDEIAEIDQTLPTQKRFSKEYFRKIAQYFVKINTQNIVENIKNKKEKFRRTYTKREIEELKDFLTEDPILEELRSTDFGLILKTVKSLLSRYPQNEQQSPELKENKNNKTQTVVSNEELNKIVKEALQSLDEFLVRKKSKEKIEKIQNWIDRIKHYHSQPEPVNSFLVLVYINDTFASTQGMVEQINLEIEMLFRRCYREWAKKTFNELNKNENFTKPEKRLFILMHIGTPYLGYRTPVFDPLLLKYLNFKNLNLYTFLLSSVFKLHKISDIDLKLINVQLFLSFLKFYVFWLSLSRSKEKERKQSFEYNKRFVVDQFMENTSWDEKDLDAFKVEKNEKETEISKYEVIDLKDIEIDYDEPESEMLNLSGHFKSFSVLEEDTSKTEIDKINYYTMSIKKPGVDVKRAININLKDFFFRDIIEKYCNTEEQELLDEHLIKKEPYEEIGEKLKISNPAVSKRVNKILIRLSKVEELKELLTEM
ncbi:MAG: hypothetical protein IPM56_04035 [Ignavibacteriales bacterium]|nr:MAG: hypothetical protein IPM56_04035 [Ignavibacteriales bacterium]